MAATSRDHMKVYYAVCVFFLVICMIGPVTMEENITVTPVAPVAPVAPENTPKDAAGSQEDLASEKASENATLASNKEPDKAENGTDETNPIQPNLSSIVNMTSSEMQQKQPSESQVMHKSSVSADIKPSEIIASKASLDMNSKVNCSDSTCIDFIINKNTTNSNNTNNNSTVPDIEPSQGGPIPEGSKGSTVHPTPTNGIASPLVSTSSSFVVNTRPLHSATVSLTSAAPLPTAASTVLSISASVPLSSSKSNQSSSSTSIQPSVDVILPLNSSSSTVQNSTTLYPELPSVTASSSVLFASTELSVSSQIIQPSSSSSSVAHFSMSNTVNASVSVVDTGRSMLSNHVTLSASMNVTSSIKPTAASEITSQTSKMSPNASISIISPDAVSQSSVSVSQSVSVLLPLESSSHSSQSLLPSSTVMPHSIPAVRPTTSHTYSTSFMVNGPGTQIVNDGDKSASISPSPTASDGMLKTPILDGGVIEDGDDKEPVVGVGATTTTTAPHVRTWQDSVYQFVFEGNCTVLLASADLTKAFLHSVQSHLAVELDIPAERVYTGGVHCGSVVVNVTIEHTDMTSIDDQIMEIIASGNFSFSLNATRDNHTEPRVLSFQAAGVKVLLSPYIMAPGPVTRTPAKTEPFDDSLLQGFWELSETERILIIVFSVLGGFLFILAAAYIVHICCLRGTSKTFELGDTPDHQVKLEDFTLTKLQRPPTIYDEHGMILTEDLIPGQTKMSVPYTSHGGARGGCCHVHVSTFKPSNNESPMVLRRANDSALHGSAENLVTHLTDHQNAHNPTRGTDNMSFSSDDILGDGDGEDNTDVDTDDDLNGGDIEEAEDELGPPPRRRPGPQRPPKI